MVISHFFIALHFSICIKHDSICILHKPLAQPNSARRIWGEPLAPPDAFDALALAFEHEGEGVEKARVAPDDEDIAPFEVGEVHDALHPAEAAAKKGDKAVGDFVVLVGFDGGAGESRDGGSGVDGDVPAGMGDQRVKEGDAILGDDQIDELNPHRFKFYRFALVGEARWLW